MSTGQDRVPLHRSASSLCGRADFAGEDVSGSPAVPEYLARHHYDIVDQVT
jgi:hypothetical protein